MGVVGEVAGFAAQRAAHPVGEVSVAAVEHGAEDLREHRRLVLRNALFGEPGDELRAGDPLVVDVTTGRPCDLGDGLGEGQQTVSGEFVDLAGVPVRGQRGDHHVGYVVSVHERLADLWGGQCHLAGADELLEALLAEVLREEGAAHDGRRGAGGQHGPLGLLCLGLAAPGQQHQSAHAGVDSGGGEPADGVHGTRRHQVRVVDQVGRRDAVQHRCPGRRVVPVERRGDGPGADADRDTEVGESLCHPAAGGTGRAGDEGQGLGVGCHE